MIYLDHAAATPVSQKALAAMMPYFSERFFNPSAPYLPAKHVREEYETAKDRIAHVIGAKGNDLVMTSGATESVNLAFTVLQKKQATACPKALVLATEHKAVLEVAKQYDYDFIAVDKNGIIRLDDLHEKIDDDTVLISVALANNELGTIQPLTEIGEIIKKVRQERLSRGVAVPLYLHSDASQALNLIDINVSRMGVDLLTLSAAKCGGPKGVGALYIGRGVEVLATNRGGGQERGLRSGTENVAGVVGFAAALTETKEHSTYHRKLYSEMYDVFQKEIALLEDVKNDAGQMLTQKIKVRFLGDRRHQLANFCPVCFEGFDAERLIYSLEMKEVYLSTGAACAANKGAKSHVLQQIGLSDREIDGSLRISFGATNTLGQAREAGIRLREAILAEYQRMYKTKVRSEQENG